jgi:predicted Fe-Mo cluster-binding NifX family protein
MQETSIGGECVMKVAVAAEGDRVASHFGRCERFVVATVADGSIGPREDVAGLAHSGDCSSPTLLAQHGVTHLIAGGMGPRAVNALAGLGIATFRGIEGSVEEALAALAAGRLVSSPTECDHSDGSCHH